MNFENTNKGGEIEKKKFEEMKELSEMAEKIDNFNDSFNECLINEVKKKYNIKITEESEAGFEQYVVDNLKKEIFLKKDLGRTDVYDDIARENYNNFLPFGNIKNIDGFDEIIKIIDKLSLEYVELYDSENNIKVRNIYDIFNNNENQIASIIFENKVNKIRREGNYNKV